MLQLVHLVDKLPLLLAEGLGSPLLDLLLDSEQQGGGGCQYGLSVNLGLSLLYEAKNSAKR